MIRIFSYSRESKRMEKPGLAELPRHLADRGRMIWVDLEDPTDEETGVLGGIFGFHVLAVEDCMQAGLLPGLRPYDGYVFAVAHAIDTRQAEAFGTLPVGIFVGENYLATYHRAHVKGIFDTRGQVAKNPGSLLRSPDWLLHGILDAMIDNYTPGLQGLEARMAALEAAFTDIPQEAHLNALLRLKQEVFHLQRTATLQGEYLERMGQGEMPWVAGENRVYFRNLSDRTVRIVQAATFFRERVSDLLAAYQSLVSRRTHSAVKALAVVVAAVMPASLILGIYGVSFNSLTGLARANVYYAALGAVALCILGSLAVFKKKRWF